MLVNNNFNINYGTSSIEYNNTGENTAYSMWGDNPPLNPTAKKFIQPIFTSSDSGFTGTQCTKDNFTIYSDSSYYDGRGIGYAFDNVTELDGASDYGGMNIWHSDRGYPHHIGFIYDKPLKVNKLTIYNGNINTIPVKYEVQYKDSNDLFVTLLSGTNTVLTMGSPWDIVLNTNIASEEWRIVFLSGEGIDGRNYVSILEVKIDADIGSKEISDLVEWEHPAFTQSSETGFGTVSYTSSYDSNCEPYKALNNVYDSSANNAFETTYPGDWILHLDNAIAISKVAFYNNTTNGKNCTKTIRLWADTAKTIPLTNNITVNSGDYKLTVININNPISSNYLVVEFIDSYQTYMGMSEIKLYYKEVK